MQEIDVLYLIEHTAREMDVACLVKAIAEEQYGLRVEIRNMYLHAEESLQQFQPKIVAHPFLYFVKGALATEDYVQAWPDAVHFNLSWEQIHYKAHWKIKSPSDEFVRSRVIHHAWGDFYKDYLLEFGTSPQNIVVNGHPAYKLYDEPYKNYYCDREQLAQKYGLDPEATWVFVPENYRWAFVGSKIKLFSKIGGDVEEIRKLESFSKKSLVMLLESCNELAANSNIQIIFRTRPATDSITMLDFFGKEVGPAEPNIYFIKNESIREWILASDIVISSYSTSLIEAAIAGKQAYMFAPIPIPESLHCQWYDLAPVLRSSDDMKTACLAPGGAESLSLKSWAEETMLSCEDPIRGLVEQFAKLAAGVEQGKPSSCPEMKKEYFNKNTHENDTFTLEELGERISNWQEVLFGVPQKEQCQQQIINKTMDRDDLFHPESKKIIDGLNTLVKRMYREGIYMSSWVGTTPPDASKLASLNGLINRCVEFFAGRLSIEMHPDEQTALVCGIEQRLDYQPLPEAADDARLPWFLYWEICWVLRTLGEKVTSESRVLDAGGSGSLFSCYLSSMGTEVHAIDLNPKLKKLGSKIQEKMGFNIHSYSMDMCELEFPDEFFDHAFSICVFEHLDIEIKRKSLAEIARCLKPGGVLGITFDYKTPAPGIAGYGKDPRPRNQLKNIADIHRSLLSHPAFELMGNQDFQDNGKSYLIHPKYGDAPYTFGAVFLRKK